MPLASRVSRLPHVAPPVLTVYLDVNPANPRNQGAPRGYLRWLRTAGQELGKELPPPARKAFRIQLSRIDNYLQTAWPRSRSLVVFAGPHVWEAIPLQVEVTEELHWGNASLQQMAWVLDEHRVRGAVLVDGYGSRFFRFWLGTVAEDPPSTFTLNISSWRKPLLVGPATPGVSKQYGVQRDRVAVRVAEQRNHFLRKVALRIADWSKEAQVSPVILIGNAAEIESLIARMPVEFRKHVDTLPKTFPKISPDEVKKRLQPMLVRWEREYEAELVDDLLSGRESRRSVTGLDQTLDQLQKGQVRELVVIRGLAGSVRQCLKCGRVDRSADPVCASCGSGRQPRSLSTVLPELASLHSVPIEVVGGRAAVKLQSRGGIGAWLLSARARSRQKTNLPSLARTA